MNADTLMKNADMALYQAKAPGSVIRSILEADIERQLLARLSIEEDLALALERHEFELFYQPLYDLRSSKISGFEALLRWIHPRVGSSPGALHPHCRGDRHDPQDRRLGHTAGMRGCPQAAARCENRRQSFAGSVPASDIAGVISEALASSGLPPGRLELEITERTLLENNATTLTLLFRLQRWGCASRWMISALAIRR